MLAVHRRDEDLVWGMHLWSREWCYKFHISWRVEFGPTHSQGGVVGAAYFGFDKDSTQDKYTIWEVHLSGKRCILSVMVKHVLLIR